jgi:hypothetical protein
MGWSEPMYLRDPLIQLGLKYLCALKDTNELATHVL